MKLGLTKFLLSLCLLVSMQVATAQDNPKPVHPKDDPEIQTMMSEYDSLSEKAREAKDEVVKRRGHFQRIVASAQASGKATANVTEAEQASPELAEATKRFKEAEAQYQKIKKEMQRIYSDETLEKRYKEREELKEKIIQEKARYKVNSKLLISLNSRLRQVERKVASYEETFFKNDEKYVEASKAFKAAKRLLTRTKIMVRKSKSTGGATISSNPEIAQAKTSVDEAVQAYAEIAKKKDEVKKTLDKLIKHKKDAYLAYLEAEKDKKK